MDASFRFRVCALITDATLAKTVAPAPAPNDGAILAKFGKTAMLIV
jgi:hypothetical protein